MLGLSRQSVTKSTTNPCPISATLTEYLNAHSVLDRFTEESSTSIEGGLRSTVIAKRFVGDLIIKKCSYSELCRQHDYINTVPTQFKAWFPKVYDCLPIHGSDHGLLVMEKLPGVTLHRFLWDDSPRSYLREKTLDVLLNKLSLLFRSEQVCGACKRDPQHWITLIRQRITSVALLPQLSTMVSKALNRIEQSRNLGISFVDLGLTHGDAQGGNFLIDTSSKALAIYMIDPLGGSGERLGDFIYDLSRLYHWIDVAAECYEYEKLTFYETSAYQKLQYEHVKTRLLTIIHNFLNDYLLVQKDHDGLAWFYIYLMFHLSGKLSNWQTPQSQFLLCSKLLAYSESLRRCLEVSHDLAD